MEKGILYIVATPIGNLEDVTLRALRILKEADVVLCEDTRVTKKLLAAIGGQKPLLSYHQRSTPSRTEEILSLLERGKNCALVSDAGTPGISDPGNELVARIIERFGNDAKIVPVPGPSSITALASISGIPMQRFYFGGYPPHKKGRKTFFENLATISDPIILLESPHRILKTLRDLQFAMGDMRHAVVGRELTKKFETVYRGSLQNIAERIAKETPRGEFVIAIAAKEKRSL